MGRYSGFDKQFVSDQSETPARLLPWPGSCDPGQVFGSVAFGFVVAVVVPLTTAIVLATGSFGNIVATPSATVTLASATTAVFSRHLIATAITADMVGFVIVPARLADLIWWIITVAALANMIAYFVRTYARNGRRAECGKACQHSQRQAGKRDLVQGVSPGFTRRLPGRVWRERGTPALIPALRDFLWWRGNSPASPTLLQGRHCALRSPGYCYSR